MYKDMIYVLNHCIVTQLNVRLHIWKHLCTWQTCWKVSSLQIHFLSGCSAKWAIWRRGCGVMLAMSVTIARLTAALIHLSIPGHCEHQRNYPTDLRRGSNWFCSPRQTKRNTLVVVFSLIQQQPRSTRHAPLADKNVSVVQCQSHFF